MNYQKELIKALSIGGVIFIVIQTINYIYNLQFPDFEALKFNFIFINIGFASEVQFFN